MNLLIWIEIGLVCLYLKRSFLLNWGSRSFTIFHLILANLYCGNQVVNNMLSFVLNYADASSCLFCCWKDIEALPNIIQRKYALLRDLDKSLQGMSHQKIITPVVCLLSLVLSFFGWSRLVTHVGSLVSLGVSGSLLRTQCLGPLP